MLAEEIKTEEESNVKQQLPNLPISTIWLISFGFF